MLLIDYDTLCKVRLVDAALEVAADAATDAHVAGADEATQLERGIQAYVLACMIIERERSLLYRSLVFFKKAFR